MAIDNAAAADDTYTQLEAPFVVTAQAEYVEVECATAELTQQPLLYDVPLDEEVQFHIAYLCEEANIPAGVVIAMIERESYYTADAVGDNGNALGYLQIWEKWHSDRMERLGVTDLLDPIENITVGVDILAELLAKYDGNIEMALTAYNCGPTGAYNNYFSKGIYANDYAERVLEICQELRFR